MNNTSILEQIAKRDRMVVIGGIVVVIIIAWLYIMTGAGMGMTAFQMTSMSMMPQDMGMGAEGSMGNMVMDAHDAMSQTATWTPTYAVLMFFMWWVMMIAMMIPSASPMILLFAALNRKQREKGAPYVETGIFATGYLIAWAGFSLAAITLQWGLERIGIINTMMVSTSGLFGGLLLLIAGIYQFTPYKQACLTHCRSPIQFITQHWKKGSGGALRMGIEHGNYCLGCCWSLMVLLFVGGVMNLYWIVGLAIFVLLEKLLPVGHRLASLAGGFLVVWGIWMIAGALIV